MTSKIEPSARPEVSSIGRGQSVSDRLIEKRAENGTESVVTKIKPEVETAEQAQKLLSGIIGKVQEAPEQASEAQSRLTEARVLELLGED